MTQWQPIETAPFAEWVLVWGPTSIVRVAAKCERQNTVWWSEGRAGAVSVKLTHWAPLPAPPSPGENGVRSEET